MTKISAIAYALLAALFYALNIPFSKLLLEHVGSASMAALLYLGAGIAVGLLSLFRKDKGQRLTRDDLPYVIGMIVLDIAAPVLLMLGIRYGSSSSASLLGCFEIAATAVTALILFKEEVSLRLWAAIGLITAASALLSFDGAAHGVIRPSVSSLLVLLATVCWGLENNCTRKISSKNTFEIVTLKGVFSGLGALAIAAVIGEKMPDVRCIFPALALGFVAYGLSIFLYVRAQSVLGAAKTSAYYAVNPFIGALISFLFLQEKLTAALLTAIPVMIGGISLVIADTLASRHEHAHTHTYRRRDGGGEHTYTITHSHGHTHILSPDRHGHRHTPAELERELKS